MTRNASPRRRGGPASRPREPRPSYSPYAIVLTFRSPTADPTAEPTRRRRRPYAVAAQAYDFLELYRREGVELQLGGSDQWGNIVSGVELTRRVEQGKVIGLTAPLLQTADGRKMGKTAAGAVWLSPARSRRPAVLRRLHAIDATRVYQTRSWVVYFSILRPFGPRRVTAMLRAGQTLAFRLLAVLAQFGGRRRDSLFEIIYGARVERDRGHGGPIGK